MDKYIFCSASVAFNAAHSTNEVVTSTGLRTYIPPGIFLYSWTIDITWLLFDEQNCEMKIGSWVRVIFMIDDWWLFPIPMLQLDGQLESEEEVTLFPMQNLTFDVGIL